MKIYQTIKWVLPILLIAGCREDDCSAAAKNWIQESPILLEEFLAVKEEILANPALIDSFSRKGLLYIGGASAGPDKFAGFDVPRLKNWFRNGHGSFYFKQGDTSVSYRQCDIGSVMATAYLRNTQDTKYNTSAKIIDSLKLRNGWFAEVVVCKGCSS